MPPTASKSSLVTRPRADHASRAAPGRPFRVGSDGLPLLPCHDAPVHVAYASNAPSTSIAQFGHVDSREDVRTQLQAFYSRTQQINQVSEMTLRIDTELELLRRSCFAQRNAQWGNVTPDQFEFKPVLDDVWTPEPANAKLSLRKMKMEGLFDGNGREFYPPDKKLDDDSVEFTRTVKVKKQVNVAASLANAFVAQNLAKIEPQMVVMEEKREVDLCLQCYLKLERADLFDKKRVEKKRAERRKKDQAAAAALLEKKRLKHQIHLLKKQQKEHKKQEKLVTDELLEEQVEDVAPPAAVILKFTRQEIEAATKERKKDRKHSRKDKKKKKKHRRKREMAEDSESDDPTPIPSPAQMNGYVYADRAPEPITLIRFEEAQDVLVSIEAIDTKSDDTCSCFYEDDDQNTFVCCDSCELWVHGACDPSLTPEAIAAMANTEDKYICPLCAGRSIMFARGIRRFSTAQRKEYPTSFISHLRTQKLNVFNIGVAFLTLSLSSQMVSYKQRYEAVLGDKEQLSEKVEALEKLVLDLGGKLPDEEALAKAKEAAKEAEAKALRDREEEAKALAALTTDDNKSKKSKLI
ncbi:Hypothetical protein PHPALM_9440 [Phytophthora palmivora]|uniref:Zinc finger PHD-type domain-containing protein n=1 Tax=Phytophthora palmivora TaxID=4796 RepID=A0A2P4Y7A6_9STRA|nr:Hypothetical protein PHPALM_9440 [Phytophthora palmivora]